MNQASANELTLEAKQSIDNAEQIATSENHAYIGTEHLLIAIIKQKHKAIASIFNEVCTEKLVKEHLGKICYYTRPSDFPAAIDANNKKEDDRKSEQKLKLELSPNLLNSIKNAKQYALVNHIEDYLKEDLPDSYIDCPHLLLGVIDQEGAVATSILKKVYPNFEGFREIVSRLSLTGSKTNQTEA